MPTTSNDGVSLSYALAGPADADAVVFVEGLGYGRWMWRWQREALADDYRVIRPDNRGTGDSDAPDGPYSIAEMADDLEAVLEDAGVESAHVVGASMGGMIAQTYALEYERADSLVLCCTSHGGEESVPVPESTQQRMFAVPDDASERERIRHRMAPAVSGTFFDENPDLAERIVDWRLESDADEPARQAQAAAVAAFDERDRLADLEIETLILHGTDDRVLPVENARLLESALPNATLELCEGGPHLFFVENANWTNERLADFLARVSRGAP